MSASVPSDPPIFHITHATNLPGILQKGGLWCDNERVARNLQTSNIGLLHIKERRRRRPVTTSAGGCLADYVPFNFCPRSVMLCAIHGRHQDFDEGQTQILHLVSSVNRAVSVGRPWAFSDRHAELGHALHFDDLSKLTEVSWSAMPQKYWVPVKEERQAEFLVHGFFPWTAITEVCSMTPELAQWVQGAIQSEAHKPAVTTRREWYY